MGGLIDSNCMGRVRTSNGAKAWAGMRLGAAYPSYWALIGDFEGPGAAQASTAGFYLFDSGTILQQAHDTRRHWDMDDSNFDRERIMLSQVQKVLLLVYFFSVLQINIHTVSSSLNPVRITTTCQMPLAACHEDHPSFSPSWRSINYTRTC